jgi:hypothetical protein
MAEVHALVIECGRRAGDDLPPRASGARIVCYAPGADLEAAIAAASAVIRDAGLSLRTVTAHGTLADRLAKGVLTASERLLMERVHRIGRVVIAELTPTYEQS